MAGAETVVARKASALPGRASGGALATVDGPGREASRSATAASVRAGLGPWRLIDLSVLVSLIGLTYLVFFGSRR